MASTNKTTNYELSQFLGTDKPAWLSDYNGDMAKIDAQMKLNADAATTASGAASTADGKIGTLTNLTTEAKTNVVAAINEVDSNTTTAQNTANSASIAAATANTNIAKFNLSDKLTLTPSTNKGSISGAYTQIQYAGDTTGSVYKVYGRILISSLENLGGTINVTIGQTPLRPTTSYNVNTGILLSRVFSDGHTDTVPRDFTVGTNGAVTFTDTLRTDITEVSIIFPPCLYFNSDFGD